MAKLMTLACIIQLLAAFRWHQVLIPPYLVRLRYLNICFFLQLAFSQNNLCCYGLFLLCLRQCFSLLFLPSKYCISNDMAVHFFCPFYLSSYKSQIFRSDSCFSLYSFSVLVPFFIFFRCRNNTNLKTCSGYFWSVSPFVGHIDACSLSKECELFDCEISSRLWP